ncbi:MAG: radical SAM family heme chaperone HemW [Chlamydiae bacterium]|nr:radical SAM family heme chaperone HemW [Chlamydiota bacterium]
MTGKKEAASLYIHIPFCTKKCPYCHFYVVPDNETLQELFIAALEKEWLLVSPQLAEKEIVSIYFGGGTPSLLGPKRLERILSWIQKGCASLAPDCEITLEANPENVSLDLMKAFQSIGVNRISLGLQSLDNTLLTLLGRGHNGSKSIQAVHDTYQAGITNISVDLMFELPHQNLSHWNATLEQVRELPITHLSLYNLVIEPKTPFHKRKKELTPHLPDEQSCRQMLDRAVEMLEEKNLLRYEISAFAKPGFTSRHNIGYWTARPFLGLGPSAFSYFNQKRFQNICHIHKYCDRMNQQISAIDFQEHLPYPENIKELLAVELRLLCGVDLEAFASKHAPLTPGMWQDLDHLVSKGWLIKEGNHIKLSLQGLLFYDSVAEEII